MSAVKHAPKLSVKLAVFDESGKLKCRSQHQQIVNQHSSCRFRLGGWDGQSSILTADLKSKSTF